ncbi:hypothetical protein FLAG1_08484 [Fusarium langsethiae]|uniref:Apple domain-containing protein n=1 Tax=Fusarium langsethiae TaxID=179993 RepID=A0A0N0DCT1_FUSLA|nr:hypothetical protein FLAG1_08484 [Fusarium langsethiae]GKU05606.1 unnamed protein product [Fusarium langsethiae]
MARHFVRSFVIAAALSPIVNAGPCRPSSSSAAAVVTTTAAETSVATGSATTQTAESSLTELLSGTSTETSLTISESGSGTTGAEQSTTTGTALSTDITTTSTGSESYSSTGTTLDTTTTTECPVPEPPVYDDPFTATSAELPATTLEADTSAAETTTAAVTVVPRNFHRRGVIEARVEDTTMTAEDPATTAEAAPSEDSIDTTEAAATATTAESTCTTETATTTTIEDGTTTTEATTTASETATGCINNLQKPTPEGAVCGSRGYVWGTTNDWRYLGEGPNDSLINCYTACQQKSNCVTFLYDKNAQCSFYAGTITELSPDRTSVRNYETRCFCDTGIEPAPTCSYDTSIVNGGFDDGKFSPWQEDPNPGGKDPVAIRVVPGGENDSSYRMQTGQFDFDKSMWIYQDVKACPGTYFSCSYRWWWDEYYTIRQNDGSSLVPYVRVYQDDDRIGNRYPTSEAQTKTWIPARFSFTVPESGETRIWFVASSPQGEWINTGDDCTPNWVHRPNSFRLDSVYCSS